MKNAYSIRFPSIDTVNNDGFFVDNANNNYAVVNPNEDHDSAENKLAFFGDDALIKKLASQAEMNFVYSLVCHDPVENEDLNLLETDDRSLVLRIMNHRRNIDGDFYAYHIEVRSAVNFSDELRHTDDVAHPFVALVPVEDEVGVAYDEVRCTGSKAEEYENLGYRVYFDPRETFDGMYIPVDGVPAAAVDCSDDLPF